jgi:hypothetical protein
MKIQFPIKGGNKHKATSAGEPLSESSDDSDENQCKSMEYWGNGNRETSVTQKDWKIVLERFHKSKQLLGGWLKEAQEQIPQESIAWMESQLKELKLIRPTSPDEPDLRWRGIGLWRRDDAGNGSLLLTSGFVKLVVKHPERGLFEMARLVAQVWSPCEFKRMEKDAPWKELLTCLEVEDDQGCESGSYSESGWAVSTSLSAVLTAPGCSLPAIHAENRWSCVQSSLSIHHHSNKANKRGSQHED